MLVLYRRAGLSEFENTVVQAPAFQAMQRRIHTHRDPTINAMGFDVIRSRLAMTDKNGSVLTTESDPRYRGGPNFPMSQADLEEKFRSCAHALSRDLQDNLLIAIDELCSGAFTTFF